MQISDLEKKKVAIWGLGREGKSALRAIRENFPDKPLTVLNDSPLDKEKDFLSSQNHVECIVGERVRLSLSEFDVVVKSPGISPYRPEVEKAKKEGVFFTSATRLWFAQQNEKTQIICLTGTKGKSTSSSLLAYALEKMGKKVILGGNVGCSMLDFRKESADIWVVEMSSYQCSDFDGKATVSVLLNLFPEHLDWHGSIENYFRDKMNLLNANHYGIKICNKTDLLTKKNLNTQALQPVFFNSESSFSVSSDAILYQGKSILPQKEITLPGSHNYSNICAVLTVIKALGLSWEKALSPLSEFRGLPHRLHSLGIYQNIEYVDDSISTTPQSAMAAVEAYANRPTTIIVGGFDRGLDWKGLAHFLVHKPVHAVVTMSKSGAIIAQEISQESNSMAKSPLLHQVKGLEEAVRVAQEITPPEGVILLSPAAPSYGDFFDFQERGKFFQEMVRKFQ